MARITENQLAEYKKALEEMKENAVLEINETLPSVNIDDLALEDITEDFLIAHFYEMGTALGVDTRQGSIYWDACMGAILRTTFFFDMLKQVKDIISLETCTGDVLDEKLRERGLTRNPEQATSAIYAVSFVGEVPDLDSAMSCDDLLFSLQKIDEQYVIVSEDVGTEMNNLATGTEVIPEIDVDGLISATLGSLLVPAVDVEDDDSARERLLSKISGPDENGTKAQIQAWCESISGVGRSRILPLWNGPNTVKGIIISDSGSAPLKSVVDAVQEYIDPGAEGMGEGMAAIGQIFTAEAVEELQINVSVKVVKTNESNYSDIQDKLKQVLKDYCKNLALESYSSDIMVRYNRISAIITEMKEIIDHENLLLNGGTENISFEINQVPVIAEVTVSGDIL